MIFWGLGITENLDGSYAVMAMVNLALNLTKSCEAMASLIASKET
jgi:predicted molibdopterin-dependent oxidoreductase YjgC